MRKGSELGQEELRAIKKDMTAIVEIVQNGELQKEINIALSNRRWAFLVMLIAIGATARSFLIGEPVSVLGEASAGLFVAACYLLYALNKTLKKVTTELGLELPHYRGDVKKREFHNHLVRQLELKYDVSLEGWILRPSRNNNIRIPEPIVVPEGMVARPYVYSYDPFLVLAIISPPY